MKRRTAKACLAIAACALSGAAWSTSYSVAILPSPDPTNIYLVPTRINDSGTILVNNSTAGELAGHFVAYAITGTRSIQLLDAQGQPSVMATGINNHNEVVGDCAPLTGIGCFWKARTEATLLATGGSLAAINDANIMAGTFNDQAAIWRSGTLQLLPVESGTAHSAVSLISNGGQAVGFMSGIHYDTVVWSADGSYAILPGFHKSDGLRVNAMNTSGTLVGLINRSGVLWQDLQPSLLPQLTPDTSAYPESINDAGVIVGTGGSRTTFLSYALMWHDGIVEDLNDYMPADLVQQGYRLTEAVGISNNGQIAAIAMRSQDSTTYFVRMVPTP